MKSTLLAAIVLGATALAAQPAPSGPPSPESVHKLVALLKVDRAREVTVAMIDRPISMAVQRALQGQEPSDDEKKEIADLHAKVTAAVNDCLSDSMLEGLYEKAYAHTFTQDEIDGLIAFFSTPVGRAYVDHEPALMQQTNAAIQKALRAKMMALQSDMRSTIQDIASAHSAGGSGLPQ